MTATLHITNVLPTAAAPAPIPIHSLLRDGGSEVGMTDLTDTAQYTEYLQEAAASTTEFAVVIVIVTYVLLYITWLLLAFLEIRRRRAYR
jgi:hypothetical protein